MRLWEDRHEPYIVNSRSLDPPDYPEEPEPIDPETQSLWDSAPPEDDDRLTGFTPAAKMELSRAFVWYARFAGFHRPA